ncbi:MAG TPA: hypothetical protein DCZ72_02275, partial [Armatimonadetes bacterium]|nr:hypothetical protein [Armatimonadota bacterium]
KHIFCEKPLAASHDDALAMVEAVNKAGVTAMCGQVVRWHPTHRRLKDMVDNGPLGGVLTMYVERRQGNWEGHPSWRLSLEKSGGTLLEVNAHELDFMLWLGGPAKTVYAVGANRIERAQDYPDFAHVSITHQSGAISVLSSSNIAVLGSYDGRFDCAHGSAVVDALFGGEIRYALRNGESGTVSPEEMKVETPVTGEVRALVEAIRAGKPSPVP